MRVCGFYRQKKITVDSKEINANRMANISVRVIASCELNYSNSPTIGQPKLMCGGDRKECIFEDIRVK